jgi:hypothetical protein
MTDQTAIVPAQQGIMPVMAIKDAVARYNAVVEFTKTVMKPGKDYGVIPGTGTKPTLLKPGAEKLCSLFGMYPLFELSTSIVDFDKGLFYFQYRCTLHRAGMPIASGLGSCNSREKKYRYRQQERTCPACGKPAIIKGKQEYGGGWICFAKKGGCGAKFSDGDQAIEGQQVGQVENTEPFDLVNTLDKMAQKRALVAATLIAANASEFFTQDVEDMDFIEGEYHDPEPPKVTVKPITPPSLEDALNMRTPRGKQLGELTDEQLQYLIEHAANGLQAAAVVVLDSRKATE